MEGGVSSNVGDKDVQDKKHSSDTEDQGQETQAIDTAEGNSAASRDLQGWHHVKNPPKELAVENDAGPAHPLHPHSDGTTANRNAQFQGAPEERKPKKRSSRSKSKTSLTTSSTSSKRSKADGMGKHSALPSSSSSVTPTNEQGREDVARPPSKAMDTAGKPKAKRRHSGDKPKSKKHATARAPASQTSTTTSEGEKGASTDSQRKDSPLSSTNSQVMLSSLLDPRRLEDPQKGKITVTVKVPESPGRSPNGGKQGVSATTQHSRMPIGTSSDHDTPSSASATSSNQGTSVAATPSHDIGQSESFKYMSSPENSAALVAKTGDERKVIPSHAKKEKTSKKTRTGGRDSTSIGGSVVAHRDEIAPKSEVASTVIWSVYPLNISFMTEINSRDERILCMAMVCVSALMLVLLTITLVLLAYARRTRSPLACVSTECQAAFDYLTRLVNASRDACSDFYGYVCDSWLEQRKDGGSFRKDNIAAWLTLINDSLMRDVGWEGHDGVGSAGVRVMRHVYGNCHHYVSTKSTSLSFEKTLAAARQQLNWTQVRSARSYKDLVEHLVQAAILSGCHTIMRMEVFRDYHEAVVSLTRGDSLLRKLTTTGDRRDLQKALEGVLKDDLDKIVQVDLAVDAKLYSNRSAEWREEPEMTIPLRDILQGIFPNVSVADWVQAFDHVLYSSGKHVYASHGAFATGAPYFTRAFREMADNDGIEVTALYAASHLDAEVLSLQWSREGISPDAKKAARFCLNLVQRSLAHSWPKLISKLMGVREGGSVLRAMNQNIKQRSHDFDVLFMWVPKTARPVVEKMIDLMTLVVASDEGGTGSFDSSDESEDEEYLPLLTYIETQSAEFVDMYLRTKSYSHKRQARSLPTVRQLYVSRFEGRHELAYTPMLHAMVVPTVYETSPYLYVTGVPSQFNYATVGALMSASVAGMMAPAALPQRRAVSALQIIRPQHASAVKMYNVSTRCLQGLHSRLGLQSDVAGTDDEQRRAMYIHAVSVRLAYEALLASFGPAATTREFHTLWPEAQRTFFIRFCLLSCDADQKPKPLSPRAGCLVPLHAMPEFADAFGCTSRDNFVTDICPL